MRALLLLTTLLALATPAAAQWDGFWCRDADEITVGIHGQALMVTHAAALYNCCPDPLHYDLSLDGTTVVMTETTLEESPCDCDCCFDLFAVITGVPETAVDLRFRWYDFESAGWVERTVPLPVGFGGAVDGPPAVEAQARSECLTDTGIAGEPTLDWSTLKRRYR